MNFVLYSPLDEDGVLQLLEERGVVDRVMQSLQLGGGGESGEGGGREVGECGGDEVRRREMDEGDVVKEVRRKEVTSDDGVLNEKTGEAATKKGSPSLPPSL